MQKTRLYDRIVTVDLEMIEDNKRMDDLRMKLTYPTTADEINILRGFGVLAVIAIHTSAYFTEIKGYNTLVLVNLWTDIFSQFAVPLFILISGFVLARNYRHNFSFKTFYKKRLRSIIPQYLIFSVLYTVFDQRVVTHSNTLSTNLSLILNHIVHFNASYHLWFFSIIIQLYILYPIIIKIYDVCQRIDRVEFLMAFLWILQTAWMVGIHATALPFLKINFISFLFYFALGIYACDHFDPLKKGLNRLSPLYLLASLALTLGSSFFIIIGLTTGYRYNAIPPYFFMGAELVYPVLRVATFLFLLSLAMSLGKRRFLSKVVNKLGDYSFGIYLIHIFFNHYAIRVLMNHHIDYNHWVFYPSVFVVTVVLSYLAVRLISYLPYSYYLIGSRNTK